MAGRSSVEKLNWPRWQQALLIAVLVLLVGNKMTMLVDAVAHRAGLTGELTYWGGTLNNAPEAEAGYAKVLEVVPGSPFARAGLREGDLVRTEPSYARLRRSVAGEKVNFTLDQDGVKSNRQITVEPVPFSEFREQYKFQRLLNALAMVVSMLISCFILWRGWGNKTAMLLGAALASQGIATLGLGLPPWASSPLLAIPMFSLVMVGVMLECLLIPFAMRMFEESVGPLPRWHWHGVKAFLVLALFGCVLATWDTIALTNNRASSAAGLALISFPASLVYLIAGWRRSAAATRNRFALIIFALAANQLAVLMQAWNLYQSSSFYDLRVSGWLNYIVAMMQGVVVPGLLAYAVLRHKLFDIGFAVNRTLVYGAVSAVLLVSVGLLEYAAKSLVPKFWTQGSVFISAGIAVGLFMIFHRIHHSVEHFIERLFFRKWQVNETALKRFVGAAAHVEKPEALAGNFVTELARFTGGAATLLYTRTAAGHYANVAGETIDADDPALAAMRAEQGPVVPAEVQSSLPVTLALPMMHQATLAGFVLLGPKPTGEDYRPDEIEIMAWATQQVGLDLQAIRVRDLELTNVRLMERNRTMADLLTGITANG